MAVLGYLVACRPWASIKPDALGDGLAVAVDLAHVGELGAGLDEQVVVDLEAQRAHDVEVELGEQVVDGVDRAGG